MYKIYTNGIMHYTATSHCVLLGERNGADSLLLRRFTFGYGLCICAYKLFAFGNVGAIVPTVGLDGVCHRGVLLGVEHEVFVLGVEKLHDLDSASHGLEPAVFHLYRLSQRLPALLPLLIRHPCARPPPVHLDLVPRIIAE